MIKRSLYHLDINMFMKLYKSLVQPGLEYCHTIWRPDKIGEIKSIEQVQARTTKLVYNIKNL